MKYGFNGAIPELISNKLLSLCGTNEKLFIFKCSLLSKKSRNIFLNSFTPYAFIFFLLYCIVQNSARNLLKFNYKDCGEVCQLFRVGKWGRPRLAGMVPGLAFARAKTQRYYDARAPRMRLLPSSAGVFYGPEYNMGLGGAVLCKTLGVRWFEGRIAPYGLSWENIKMISCE